MECSPVSQREEFVTLVETQAVGFAELCRRFGVSRRTGYKWLGRFQSHGPGGLTDRSRRPRRSPARTPPEMEQAVLAVRAAHPAWGGRKIRRVLLNQGRRDPPAASTITMILHRHGLIDPAESRQREPWKRFEHPRPNDLWQMDFKGHFALQRRRCHPLTVLDDHSRYCVGLRACGDERGTTVRQRLTAMFQRYGLPRRMLMDNGSPWAGDGDHPWTPLTVWLLTLGIDVSHGWPYHPQTQGKDERFHRTLQAEVLSRRRFDDLDDCQRGFDDWRRTYNQDRPHDALELDTPAQRYQPSRWSFSSASAPIEYGPDDAVRKVQQGGILHFGNREFRVGKAFRRQRVAVRPTTQDGVWDVVFCRTRIAWINVREQTSGRPRRRSEQAAAGGTSSVFRLPPWSPSAPGPPPWASFPPQGGGRPQEDELAALEAV
jgi:transposase InsO family protein